MQRNTSKFLVKDTQLYNYFILLRVNPFKTSGSEGALRTPRDHDLFWSGKNSSCSRLWEERPKAGQFKGDFDMS